MFIIGRVKLLKLRKNISYYLLQRSCGKVMLSQVSVILFTGADTPPGYTPPGQTPNTALGQTPPTPWPDPPWVDTLHPPADGY